MSRLYDRLMRELPDQSVLRKLIERSTVISADNVAEYYFSFPKGGGWDIRDFPSLVPPLPSLFVEYKRPPLLDMKEFPDWTPTACGVYVLTVDWQPDIPFQWNAAFPGLDSKRDAAGNNPLGVRWCVTLWLVAESGKNGSRIPWSTVHQYFLDEDGQLLMSEGGKPHIYSSGLRTDIHGRLAQEFVNRGMTAEDAVFAEREFPWLYYGAVLLAIAFMHCKNVVTKQVRPEDWQQKAARKKHHPPLVTYRVLEIEPMKNVLRTEGKSEQHGLKTALHICRGHFKTYTADKPLFGRVTGTYWWQPHVRGSVEEGIALKDYAVTAPNAKA